MRNQGYRRNIAALFMCIELNKTFCYKAIRDVYERSPQMYENY